MCVAGERLTDAEVDSIFKFTGTEEDIEGNIKYEGRFIQQAVCCNLVYD